MRPLVLLTRDTRLKVYAVSSLTTFFLVVALEMEFLLNNHYEDFSYVADTHDVETSWIINDSLVTRSPLLLPSEARFVISLVRLKQWN